MRNDVSKPLLKKRIIWSLVEWSIELMAWLKKGNQGALPNKLALLDSQIICSLAQFAVD